MPLLAAFPDAEYELCQVIPNAAAGLKADTVTPADWTGMLPFCRVTRTGGGDDRITDTSFITVDVFAATRAAAVSTFEAIRQYLTQEGGGSPVRKGGTSLRRRKHNGLVAVEERAGCVDDVSRPGPATREQWRCASTRAVPDVDVLDRAGEVVSVGQRDECAPLHIHCWYKSAVAEYGTVRGGLLAKHGDRGCWPVQDERVDGDIVAAAAVPHHAGAGRVRPVGLPLVDDECGPNP